MHRLGRRCLLGGEQADVAEYSSEVSQQALSSSPHGLVGWMQSMARLLVVDCLSNIVFQVSAFACLLLLPSDGLLVCGTESVARIDRYFNSRTLRAAITTEWPVVLPMADWISYRG